MKKRKNILYIGNKLSKKGNTVSTIERLAGKLQEEGFVVKTASAVQSKPLRMVDMLYCVYKNRKWTDLVLIDTYSTLNFQYAVQTASLCRFFNIPYIPILHGGNLPSRIQKSKKQSKKLFGKAQVNVAPSHYLLETFKKEGYGNLVYIPNTIEIADYPFLLRKKIKPKLLWVRSFSEIYNPMLAIHVLENLIHTGYKEAELCMIGPEKDGSLDRCKKYVDQKKLPVSFTGSLSKTEWIQHSQGYDIFINTTNIDNTPVSVIEAMALGLPVISTNVGGMPFLIEDKKDGLLTPTNEVEAFSNKIKSMLTNSFNVEAITLNARKKVEQYDWKKVKKLWNNTLQG